MQLNLYIILKVHLRENNIFVKVFPSGSIVSNFIFVEDQWSSKVCKRFFWVWSKTHTEPIGSIVFNLTFVEDQWSSNFRKRFIWVLSNTHTEPIASVEK